MIAIQPGIPSVKAPAVEMKVPHGSSCLVAERTPPGVSEGLRGEDERVVQRFALQIIEYIRLFTELQRSVPWV